jgi:hypothetical protein
MKLPLIQKLDILPSQFEELGTVFKKNAIGSGPTLLQFPELEGKKLGEVQKMCEEIFKQLGINPRFPYPTYIISEVGINQTFFPELKSTRAIPKHFIKKIKRIKKREQSLLDKITTLSERIKNHNISQDLNYLTNKSVKNKELRNLCSEKGFYLELIESMRSSNRDEVL